MSGRISERNILSKGSVITLKKIGTDPQKIWIENFTIISTIDDNDVFPTTREGGSAVCYEAMDENGVCGRLKELYPVYSNKGYSLVRLGNHQLAVEDCFFSGEKAQSRFQEDCNDLIRTYEELKEVRNSGSDLNNYMPSSIDLYEGYSPCDENAGSVYVWTKNDKKVITFDKYLETVKADVSEGKKAAIHLLNILNGIFTLSKCIRSLHIEHIYHLDIKPANFGICVDIDDEVDAGNISLFDINSIRCWDSNLPVKSAGTAGFSPVEFSPENTLKPSGKSDIYSIGATLYYALMCLNNNDNYYKDSNYKNISKIIASSELLQASDLNSDSKLFDCLVNILNKSLRKSQKERYVKTSTEGLVEDLRQAINILYPEAKKQKIDELGKSLKISREFVDIEKELDGSIKTGAAGAIQRLLLNKPLYEYMNNSSGINVLVLGVGTYSQKFIDLAFEVSQIRNCKLTVTVVSNNCKKNKERYLNARPAFKKFFTVDEDIVPEEISYGTLLFKSTAAPNDINRSFSKDNQQLNKQIIDDVFLDGEMSGFSYIFIALGDDELNRELAKVCIENTQASDYKTLISFAQYKNWGENWNDIKCFDFCKSNPDVVPVMVNEVIAKTPEYKELRRMAFNCHILWDNTLSIDLQKAKGKFKSPYNFNSSFSNVLSIKYKLHSMGIDLVEYSESELREKGEEFFRKINNIIDFNELAMFEHRRWVCNSICNGWDTLEKEDFSVLKNSTKDSKNKRHPCIVTGDCEWSLNGSEWTHSRWNSPMALNGNLDALDSMSVRLHQHFVKEAEKVNTSEIFDQTEKISSLIDSYPKVMDLWNSLSCALTEIIYNTQNHIWLYEFYHSRFLESLESLPDRIREDIKDRIGFIDGRLFPILESKKYVDYKAKDQVLVKNIPFILTYSTSIRLCIPFGVEAKGEINNRVLFNNIAAPLYLNPSVITYIVDTDDFSDDVLRFEKALKYAVGTLDERKMQAKIDLIFLRNMTTDLVQDFQAKIKAISPRVGNMEIIEYRDDEELQIKLNVVFEKDKIGGRKKFTAIEKNNTSISKLLRGFGCYIDIPTYSLDNSAGENKFITDKGCQYFNYVQFDEHLRVAEMFASQKVTGGTQPPEIPEYMDFWNLYKSDVNDTASKKEFAWKTLCKVLKSQAETDGCLGKISIPKKQGDSFRDRTLIVPDVGYSGIKKILQCLCEISPYFVGNTPDIKYVTSQSCQVEFKADDETYKALEKLFSNPYFLSNGDRIGVNKITESGKGKAIVYFNNLVVSSLSVSELATEFSGSEDRAVKMLKELYEKKKILAFSNDNKTISFCYASPQIKEIMTNEGRVLELYVYYKCLEENYFDDIVCDYKVYDEENVSSEFDLILTKNFRTMIVECKACTTLEPSFYHKLAQLNQQYGVNSKPVLVADTLEKDWWSDTEINEGQRSCGNRYDIQTVYKDEDIKEIGKVLRGIMENT